MKNVTITNREIALRAVGTLLALGIGYHLVQNTELDNATDPGASSSIVDTSQPDRRGSVLSVPPSARPYDEPAMCGDVTHEIYIGMPESGVACQVGIPEQVNSWTNSYGTNSQYVFVGRDGTRWYVFTSSGLVSSWHESWTKSQ